MKKILWSMSLMLVLCLWLIPYNAHAFTFNASNFSGYLAWDSEGDVIGAYDLDPSLNYENTGEYFNVAAGLMFDFEYIPSYPTYQDIMENPETEWMWTFSASNICVPCENTPLPEFVFSHRASLADIMEGVNWAQNEFGGFIPEDIAYNFNYELTGPTSGTAFLSLAGNAPLYMLPDNIPQSGFLTYDCDADLSVTVEPVPEPVTLVLFGTGMAGVALVRRFKK